MIAHQGLLSIVALSQAPRADLGSCFALASFVGDVDWFVTTEDESGSTAAPIFEPAELEVQSPLSDGKGDLAPSDLEGLFGGLLFFKIRPHGLGDCDHGSCLALGCDDASLILWLVNSFNAILVNKPQFQPTEPVAQCGIVIKKSIAASGIVRRRIVPLSPPKLPPIRARVQAATSASGAKAT